MQDTWTVKERYDQKDDIEINDRGFWTSHKDMSNVFHSYFEGTAVGVKKLNRL